ncbi:hypothetical protein CSW08_13310 [Confluentibacter flavum]|uniref:Uncharacterized protein n=2 Tax=Confluentibacter flavum TaxID=1909700 RepID=A0A2N3HHD7_9FLAO|nr:hypothetical protein CSW08_13310 [Confluentibacter flavum]
MFKLKYKIVVFYLLSLVFSPKTNAQCAMCRAVLESEEGQTAAQGINDGIVYLMAIPYILVAGISYLIYRKFYRVNAKLNK